jgi:hypothetical protein
MGEGVRVIGHRPISGILRNPFRALLERLNRRRLVVVDVEDCVQPRDLQQVADVLVQVHQLEFAALVAQGSVVAHQLADARAVDVDHALEVEQDLLIAFTDEFLHRVAQLARALSQTKLAADINDGDVAYGSRTCLNRHVHTPRLQFDGGDRVPKCITKNEVGASISLLVNPWATNANLAQGEFERAIMRLLQWIVAVALLAAPAAAQKIDWLIVPGQRVGPVTANTTRADLDAIFGKENVQERNLERNGGPEAATVVFPTDPSAALAITWDRERPSAIRICFGTQSGPCRWRTASGIRIGMSLRELDRLNGKSFQVDGFNLEQGKVSSWRHGALEEDPAACGHLVVGLAPAAMIDGRSMSKDESGLWKQLQGEKPYSSSYLPLQELNTTVSALTLEFTGSGCRK